MSAPPSLLRLLAWLGFDATPPSRARRRTAPARVRPAPAPAPAPDLDPHDLSQGALRASLVRALFETRDRATDPADKGLCDRLLRALGSDTLDLPVFPRVAHQLDALLRGGDPSVRDVTDLIRQEPDLVRRTWARASSAAYARRATSLDHAVTRIGFDALWQIAMQACFASPVFRVPGHEAALDGLRVRGVATAALAGWLADAPRGDAYLAGLLHGAGGLLVYRAAGPARRDQAPDPAQVRRLAVDLEPALGALLAHTWGLSAAVVAGIACSLDPERAPRTGAACAQQVHAARIAVRAAIAGVTDPRGSSLAALARQGPLIFDAERALELAHQALDDAGGIRPRLPEADPSA